MKKKLYRITSEIKNGSSEEYFFDESLTVSDILNQFTALSEQKIKDAEYFFSNDHSYIYEYKYNGKPIEIVLTFEELFVTTAQNIGE